MSPRAMRYVFALFLVLTYAFSSAAVIGIHINDHPKFTPIDEVLYLDYVYKVTEGNYIVQKGERESEWTLQEYACRGVDLYPVENPHICEFGTDASEAPYNTADIDPPTYYWITAALATTLQKLGIADNLMDAARATGIVWAFVSMLLLYGFTRYLGAGRIASWLVGFSIIAIPLFLDQYRFVSPHASDVLVGTLMAWSSIAFFRRQIGVWAVGLSALSTTMFKPVNLVCALAFGLFFLICVINYWRNRDTRNTKRSLLGLGGVIGGLALGSAAWLIARTSLTRVDGNIYVAEQNPQLTFDAFASNTGNFLRPLAPHYALGLGTMFMVFSVGALIVAVAHRHLVTQEVRFAAAATITGFVFGSTFLIAMNFYLSNIIFAIPNRYGISLYPLAIALSAVLLLKNRILQVGYFAFLAVFTLWSLLGNDIVTYGF